MDIATWLSCGAALVSIAGAAVTVWNRPTAEWVLVATADEWGWEEGEDGYDVATEVVVRTVTLKQCGDGTAFNIKVRGEQCRASLAGVPVEAVCRPGDAIKARIKNPGSAPEGAGIVITWTHPPTWRRRHWWYREPRQRIPVGRPPEAP